MEDGRFDVIVVGGGAMGTATARNLAMRGRHTLLLERFTFGHANGSSGGPTRIFRFMYHTQGYARMALAAKGAWDELQDAAGERLLHVTGGIDIGEPALPRAEVLKEIGAPVERLLPDQAHERWPDLHIPEGADIVFQPDGGVLRAARTVQVQAALAAGAGAEILEETTVTSIAVTGDRAEVHTGAGATFTAPTVVVTAGAWAGPVLRTAGIDLPLQPSLEQGTYFRLDGGGSVGTRPTGPLPTIIDWFHDEVQPPYLVPDPFEDATGHFKVGLHRSGPVTDAETRTFDPDPARVARVQTWVDRHVDGAVPLDRTDTCLYTFAPDEDFILDRVGPVVVASPCSGHGFKFVPLFGQVIADLATGVTPAFPMAPFTLDRAALRAAG
ncbi:MAG TPA: FAD-dependent oxidoreductase [Actinomycetota bacterium]